MCVFAYFFHSDLCFHVPSSFWISLETQSHSYNSEGLVGGGSFIFTILEVYREAGALRVEKHEKEIMEYSVNNYDRRSKLKVFFYDDTAFKQRIIHMNML